MRERHLEQELNIEMQDPVIEEAGIDGLRRTSANVRQAGAGREVGVTGGGKIRVQALCAEAACPLETPSSRQKEEGGHG